MEIQISAIPYDSGYKSTRMGRGPEQFLLHGASWRLMEAGHQVNVRLVEASEGFQAEISTAFELCRVVSVQVREACQRGVFPLILSGNCGGTLGALSGLEMNGLGLVWFDAHGDFNTPETTTSGFLDGMALATITGHCWKLLAASVPGFSPLPARRIIHLGSRQLDSQEEELIARSGVVLLPADRLRAEGVRPALAPALADLAGSVQRIYIHLDLDVLDPQVAPANVFSPPGGLTVEQALEAIRLVRETYPVVGATLASYEPEGDKDQRALRAGLRLLEGLVQAASST